MQDNIIFQNVLLSLNWNSIHTVILDDLKLSPTYILELTHMYYLNSKLWMKTVSIVNSDDVAKFRFLSNVNMIFSCIACTWM